MMADWDFHFNVPRKIMECSCQSSWILSSKTSCDVSNKSHVLQSVKVPSSLFSLCYWIVQDLDLEVTGDRWQVTVSQVKNICPFLFLSSHAGQMSQSVWWIARHFLCGTSSSGMWLFILPETHLLYLNLYSQVTLNVSDASHSFDKQLGKHRYWI